MKDKLTKRRHYIDYRSAISFYDLEEEYYVYLAQQLRANKYRRKKPINSQRRIQRNFCLSKGLKLVGTVFDLSIESNRV